jgi:hypothetical protein
MKKLATLTFCVGLLVSTSALAEPPAVGGTHTFFDPVYSGTVFCDTLEQVQEIVTAENPQEVYRRYLYRKNSLGEPVCLAIIPTGEVQSVTPLGVMKRDGMHFNAWAVEITVNGVTGVGLYLEKFELVVA